MSLTTLLAVLGALVLAAVIAHGAWTARKAGPKRVSVVPPLQGEAPGERREPTMGGEPSAAGVAPPAANDGGASATDESHNLADSGFDAVKLPGFRSTSARLDALVDAIVPLTLESPISAEFALLHMPPTRRAGSKPFLIEGLNTETADWEPLTPGQHYGELQAGVLMANRGGALNEIEYSEFVQKIEAFAQAIGAMPDAPDMLDVVARARELDTFAGTHDAQLALRLVAAGAAWSIGFVTQHAARQGLVPGAVPGRLVLPSTEEGAPPVLSLNFDPQAALSDDPSQAVVSDLTLSLDVPQTAATVEPFALWQEVARGLAQDIDARLVDDAGQPVNLHAFASIGHDLQELYVQLESRDIAAGSTAARRLFS